MPQVQPYSPIPGIKNKVEHDGVFTHKGRRFIIQWSDSLIKNMKPIPKIVQGNEKVKQGFLRMNQMNDEEFKAYREHFHIGDDGTYLDWETEEEKQKKLRSDQATAIVIEQDEGEEDNPEENNEDDEEIARRILKETEDVETGEVFKGQRLELFEIEKKKTKNEKRKQKSKSKRKEKRKTKVYTPDNRKPDDGYDENDEEEGEESEDERPKIQTKPRSVEDFKKLQYDEGSIITRKMYRRVIHPASLVKGIKYLFSILPLINSLVFSTNSTGPQNEIQVKVQSLSQSIYKRIGFCLFSHMRIAAYATWDYTKKLSLPQAVPEFLPIFLRYFGLKYGFQNGGAASSEKVKKMSEEYQNFMFQRSILHSRAHNVKVETSGQYQERKRRQAEEKEQYQDQVDELKEKLRVALEDFEDCGFINTALFDPNEMWNDPKGQGKRAAVYSYESMMFNEGINYSKGSKIDKLFMAHDCDLTKWREMRQRQRAEAYDYERFQNEVYDEIHHLTRKMYGLACDMQNEIKAEREKVGETGERVKRAFMTVFQSMSRSLLLDGMMSLVLLSETEEQALKIYRSFSRTSGILSKEKCSKMIDTFYKMLSPARKEVLDAYLVVKNRGAKEVDFHRPPMTGTVQSLVHYIQAISADKNADNMYPSWSFDALGQLIEFEHLKMGYEFDKEMAQKFAKKLATYSESKAVRTFGKIHPWGYAGDTDGNLGKECFESQTEQKSEAGSIPEYKITSTENVRESVEGMAAQVQLKKICQSDEEKLTWLSQVSLIRGKSPIDYFVPTHNPSTDFKDSKFPSPSTGDVVYIGAFDKDGNSIPSNCNLDISPGSV